MNIEVNNTNTSKPILIRAIIILILGFLLVLFGFLKENVYVAEFFTRGISRGYFYFASLISKYIPFSLTEVYYVFLFGFSIFLIVRGIFFLKNDQLDLATKCLFNIIILALSTVCLYNLTFSFAYNRKPVDLPFYKEEVANSEFVDLYNFYADDLNYCISQLEFSEDGELQSKLSFSETSDLIEESYHILDSSSYYSKRSTRAKMMMSSFFYTEMNITGVTFAPLGEANVNYMIPKSELPFTMAHELAHTKGVAREDEANQVAFYVCLNSEEPLIRFSAYACYFSQIRTLASKRYMTEEQLEKLHDINPYYYLNQNSMYSFWNKHTFFKDVGDFFNDLYIKMSGVKEGTKSYSGGTTIDYDKEKAKLIPSRYQMLYLERYYRLKTK